MTTDVSVLAIAVYQLHTPDVWQRVFPGTGQREVPQFICAHCSMLTNHRVPYPCRTVEIVDRWVGPPRLPDELDAEALDRLKLTLGIEVEQR